MPVIGTDSMVSTTLVNELSYTLSLAILVGVVNKSNNRKLYRPGTITRVYGVPIILRTKNTW